MLRLVSILILALLASACGFVTSPPPAPTPTLVKPANLLTPRPTVPPATPTPRVVAAPRIALPTLIPTPAPSVRGMPVAASEPLQGLLLDDRLTSPIIGESFPYRIYLPPDYQRSPQKRFPVLYMLHGAGGNYTEWADSFLPEQADRLIVARVIPPIIVVMPDDGGQTYWANWSDDGPRWGDYLTEDIVSTIDQRYRTLANPQSRAIGGLSMGGLGALNLAFQHPDVFGVVGAHSPSVRLEPDPALPFLQGQTFWENDPVWLARTDPASIPSQSGWMPGMRTCGCRI